MQWCMKYHITTGVKVFDDNKVFSTIDRMKSGNWMLDRDYTFDLSGTDRFLSELNVTDLHFSFRIDTVDTICSHMIAEAHDTWVVNNNEIKEHAKLKLDTKVLRDLCISSDMAYSLYTILELMHISLTALGSRFNFVCSLISLSLTTQVS